jgi:hypothetical protein
MGSLGWDLARLRDVPAERLAASIRANFDRAFGLS